MVVQACLNGDRDSGVPRWPEELAAEARACIAAGASSVHAHPRDPDGQETLDDGHVAAAVRALRAALGRTQISLSSGLWITAGDVEARQRAIASWTERPDLVTLSLAEEGWRELAQLLAERGIGIEAGLWTAGDAEALAHSGLVAKWGPPARGPRGSRRRHPPVHRILVEPRSETAEEAVAVAREIDAVLDAAAIPTARLHHGVGPATWAVLDAAVPRGHEIRIGLEDVLTLPDGRPAPDSAALVVEAVLRYR